MYGRRFFLVLVRVRKCAGVQKIEGEDACRNICSCLDSAAGHEIAPSTVALGCQVWRRIAEGTVGETGANCATQLIRFRAETGRPIEGHYKAPHVEVGHALA